MLSCIATLCKCNLIFWTKRLGDTLKMNMALVYKSSTADYMFGCAQYHVCWGDLGNPENIKCLIFILNNKKSFIIKLANCISKPMTCV